MAFKTALTNPFSSRAEGARVPDAFQFPTKTCVFKSKFSISAPPDIGSIDLVFGPS